MTDVQNSHQKKLDLAQDIADAEISRTLRKAKVSAIFRYVILIIVRMTFGITNLKVLSM